MKTGTLLKTTAVIEIATGVTLILLPGATVRLLLGTTLDAPAAFVLARVAGAALVALGMACWSGRSEEGSRAMRALVTAMLFYNVAAAAILAWAGGGLGLAGIGLWPAVVLHAALGAWCIACLRRAN